VHKLQQLKSKSVPEGASFSLRASLCLPSSCNATDFENIASQVVSVFDPTQVTSTVDTKECFTLETALPDLNAETIVAIVICAILIGVILFNTV